MELAIFIYSHKLTDEQTIYYILSKDLKLFHKLIKQVNIDNFVERCVIRSRIKIKEEIKLENVVIS